MKRLNTRLVATLLATSVNAVAAQGRVSCPGGIPEPSFGVADLDCVQCTVHSGSGATWVQFGSEPTVKRTMGRNGLQAGDVIVSIDGMLITTAAGGQLFASPKAAQASEIVVRRSGRPVTVSVTPTINCHVGFAGGQFWRADSGRTQSEFTLNDGTPVVVSRRADAMVPRAFARLQSDSAGGRLVRGATADTFYAPRRSDSFSTGALRARLDSVIRERGFVANGSSAIGFPITDSAPRAARISATPARAAFGAAGAAYRDSNRVQLAYRDSLAAQRAYVAGRGAGAGGGFAGGTVTGVAPRRIGSLMAGRVADSAMAATDSATRRNYVTIRGGAGGTYSFGRGSRISDSVAPGGFLGTAEPTTMSSGWLGFGFDCSNCSVETGADGRRLWRFPTAPSIAGVEPGSAAELAGLRVGDIVREIDGVSLTWPAGAARFSAIKPGQKVRLTIVRKGKVQEVTMTARARVTRT